jgi:hypothetical protein
MLLYVGNTLGASTVTDANGRYEFCKVPAGSTRVMVPDPTDYDLGGPLAEATTVVVGDTILDLQLPR